MKEVEWETMDKDQIIDLVIENMAAGDVSNDVKNRVRGKLENMTGTELWKHIARVYGGKLYTADTPVVIDEREKWRRERIMNTPVIHKKHARDKVSVATETTYTDIEEAHNVICGKDCVYDVQRYGDLLVVLLKDKTIADKVTRWVYRRWPSVNIKIITQEA
jgi:hypothetical protein